MGRLEALAAKTAQVKEADKQSVEAEVEDMSFRPDNIDAETWSLILDNGRRATELLSEILNSPKFHRMRPGDQAKLIKLAQDRAYGLPQQSRGADAGGKRRAGALDVTAAELNDLVSRAALPEYKLTRQATDDIEDAEEI